jgi:hypothetical protein
MADEGKLRAQAARADRARQVYEQDIVQEALAVIDKTINDAWRNSTADEKECRDNAYVMHRLLENFKQQFLHAMATGEAAKKELLTINDPSRVRRFISGRR